MYQSQKPPIGIDKVLKNGFGYWKKTLLYQVIYSLLYLSILFSVLMHFADQFGILEDYMKVVEKSQNGGNLIAEVQTLTEKPNFMKFQLVQIVTLCLLFPLQVGFFKIFRKIDLKEKYGMQDFLSGYTGINFFIYSSFYLFWYIIFGYAMSTVILGLVWILLTLFTVPLMFFENKRIFETIKVNFHLLRKHFLLIFAGVIVSFIFKIAGALTLVGLFFVMAFSNAMIYSIYKEIYTEK